MGVPGPTRHANSLSSLLNTAPPLYRKFKPLLFLFAAISLNWRGCQSSESFMKISMLRRWLGQRSGRRVRNVPDRAARSHPEGAAASARVGNRLGLPRSSGIARSLRWRARGRVGTPRWLRILTITAGSSMPVRACQRGGDDLQAAAAVGQGAMSSEDPFEQACLTQARRRALRVKCRP